MRLGLLTGIKTWFTAASVGAKVGVVVVGTAVAVGAVATPIVVISSQNNNEATNNSSGVNADLNGGQELSAEQQAYCENMLNYMANNNGKVPEGENREEVMQMCYGESSNTSGSSGTMTFMSLEEASQFKWEAEHCTFYYAKNAGASTNMTCDATKPWGLPDNLTNFYNLQLQYCADWDEGRTQPTNIDCSAHGADWVDNLAWELSDKTDWTEDIKIQNLDVWAWLEPIPGTEHGYKLYEGDQNPTFPSELLRTDCEKVVRTEPAVEEDSEGSIIREFEMTYEYWVCPTLPTNNVYEQK